MLGIAITILYGGIGYLITTNLQRQTQSAEFVSRINPAIVAAQFAAGFGTSRTYIVTLEPLVVQMFAPPAVKVLALRAINSRVLTKLTAGEPGTIFVFVKQAAYENQLASERYAAQLNCINSLHRRELYVDVDFSLVQLSVPRDGHAPCEPGVAHAAR
jgi:hypothetical protein